MRWFYALVVTLLIAWEATLVTQAQSSRNEDENVSKIDRRPGILHAPSEVPTGDQAHLYTDQALGFAPTYEN
jgi:uncharacterized membrane-anchored protein